MHRTAVNSILEQIEGFNEAFRYAPPNEEWGTKLAIELGTLSHATVEFRLYRTGELRLTPSMNAGLSSEAMSLLSRHSYYFIRDCAHNHQHHRPQDDRLLPAVRTSEGDGQQDDTTWRREVLWALTRIIGQYRRNKSFGQRRQALGVMAYAEAFQATLARIRRRADDTERHYLNESLASFDFAHQRASIQVANDVSAWGRQGAFAAWALAVASVISICSLWVATARLQITEEWPKAWLAPDVARAFYLNPFAPLATVLVAIVTIYAITYGPGRFDPMEQVKRNALGIALAGMPRRLGVRRLALLGLLLLVLCGLLEFQIGLFSKLIDLAGPFMESVFDFLKI